MAKQYLMMIEEATLPLIKQALLGLSIQFLEVQGMNVQNGVSILVTPILPPVNPMPVIAPPTIVTDEKPPEQAAE